MKVKLRELREVGARYSEKRRGNRMNSRAHVRVEWEVSAGQRQSADAYTRVINPYGCMIVLPDSLEMDQRVALTNLATSVGNTAVVVWKGNRQRDGWEYGIELVTPEMGFWGMEL